MSKVKLILVVLVAGLASPAAAQVFPSPTITSDVAFTDALGGTSMTLTWDGASYWSCSGGGASGVRYARYAATGTLLGTFSPGIDFRSIYSLGGVVFARAYASMALLQQTSPGVFAASGVTLAGSVDSQSAVVPSGSGTELIALDAGTVRRWTLAGASLPGVPLVGFGTQNSEGAYPQGRGIAASGSYWYTYSNGVLSAWNATGTRVGQATLTGAGTTFDSHFSLSFANGRIWIVDAPGGSWRGYAVGGAREPEVVPTLGEAGLALLALVLAAAGTLAVRGRVL